MMRHFMLIYLISRSRKIIAIECISIYYICFRNVSREEEAKRDACKR